MRLIDADAFRREIDNHWPFTKEEQGKHGIADMAKSTLLLVLSQMPTVTPEPLTDKEQRIFLAAMEREKNICEEVDRNYVREPYEDSLVRVCKEITRKVKGALWT